MGCNVISYLSCAAAPLQVACSTITVYLFEQFILSRTANTAAHPVSCSCLIASAGKHWQVSPGHTCLVTGPCEETYQGLCALSDACCANEGQEHCDTAMLLTPAAARPLWEALSKSCTAQACCWACRVCMPGVAPPATHTSDLAMQQQECRLRGCFDRSLAKGSTHRQGI